MRNKSVTVIEVADFLELTPRTVINITSNYNEGGFQKSLQDDPRPGSSPKFNNQIKSQRRIRATFEHLSRASLDQY